MFNICCDEKIPFAHEAFRLLGNVTYCKGSQLTSIELKHVDALMIRSGTRVDRDLLEGTRVQFVASATAGTDHVDLAYLKRAGIPFFHAPGCNADSVAEYVTAALLYLSAHRGVPLEGRCVGIVGAGNTGGRVARRLQALGADVVVSDPPLLENPRSSELHFEFVSFDELLHRSDIVSFHVPLVYEGPHPTFHMLDRDAMSNLKEGVWLVNASRGAVISTTALASYLSARNLGALVLDVWENEPAIDIGFLDRVDLATPHIAGYSYDGKVQGTIMIYEAFIEHYGLDPVWDYEIVLAPDRDDTPALSPPCSDLDATQALHALVRQMYDIEADDARLRKIADLHEAQRPDYFRQLRKTYPRRRSFHRHYLEDRYLEDRYLEDSKILNRLPFGFIIKGLGIPVRGSAQG